MGDGGSPRDDTPLRVILPESPENRPDIKTGVAVKLGIFRGDNPRDHVGGDLFQRDVCSTACLGIEDFVQQITIPIENACRFKLSGMFVQIFNGGEAGGQRVVLVNPERDDSDHNGDENKSSEYGHSQSAPTAGIPALPIPAAPFFRLGGRDVGGGADLCGANIRFRHTLR